MMGQAASLDTALTALPYDLCHVQSMKRTHAQMLRQLTAANTCSVPCHAPTQFLWARRPLCTARTALRLPPCTLTAMADAATAPAPVSTSPSPAAARAEIALRKAAECKAAGNAHFKAGTPEDVAAAIKSYKFGMLHLRSILAYAGQDPAVSSFISPEFAAADADITAAQELQTTLLSNLAASYLKQGKPAFAKKYAEQGLALHPKHPKLALFYGRACVSLGDAAQAVEVLHSAACEYTKNDATGKNLRTCLALAKDEAKLAHARYQARLAERLAVHGVTSGN